MRAPILRATIATIALVGASANVAGPCFAQAPPGAEAPHFRIAPPLKHHRGRSPCATPPSPVPLIPPPAPLHTQTVPPPARAVAEHVNGCAGIRFRIAPDGKPRDIAVMMEFPGDFGFGEAARQVIAESLWKPGLDDAWHYVQLKIEATK